MTSTFNIESLVADLVPVRALRRRDAIGSIVAATAVASVAVIAVFGIRPDIMAGNPHPIVILRAGLLILLGLATVGAVAAAARPAVGRANNGWLWALAAAALLPAAALIRFAYNMMTGDMLDTYLIDLEFGGKCLAISGVGGLWIGSLLTLWLRRGAPTALNRAGWLVGLAAGSFGTFSYSLFCGSDSIFYIGFWYSIAVALCAVVGRLIVPPLIRW
jgi:hypothetical protein